MIPIRSNTVRNKTKYKTQIRDEKNIKRAEYVLDRIKLIDVILDNQSAPDVDLITALENFIASSKPYNHEEDSSLRGCGVEKPSPDKFAKLKDTNCSTLSEEAELIESIFNKRELAYLVVSSKKQLIELQKVLKEIYKVIKERDDE